MDTEKSDLFYHHLELWAHSQPKEAPLMPYVDVSDTHFCTTETGEVNLYRQKGDQRAYYHAQEGALLEANRWFATLNQEHEGALYIYGLGLGYYYQAAKQWLHANPERLLIFLEDDPAVVSRFFETEAARELLEDAQVHLILLRDPTVKKKVLEEAYWRAPLAKALVSGLEYYKNSRKEIYTELVHEITYNSELTKALIDEYLDGGASYFVNFYQNLLSLPGSYRGNGFFGKFSKVPAIICGAGPSLEKNMGILKQIKEKALIFAGGSAINILNKGGIQPHLCAGIDPNTAQNVRLMHTQAFEVPFFYRNRLNHAAFQTIHGPHLYLTGSGGYDVAKYFETVLGIEGEDLDEGHNVVTFMLETAHRMGCDPILFVGMDLAFTDRKTYSSGVVFDLVIEKKGLEEYANFEKTGILRKDIFGKPIYTLWKWTAEAEWIGEWAKAHQDVRLYNCTEGGIGFPSVENSTLQEAVDKYLVFSYDLQGWIQAEIQNCSMPEVTSEKVLGAIEELKQSLMRSEKDLDILIEDDEKIAKKLSDEGAQIPLMQSGRAALAETDLAEEPAYAAILAIFNQVFSSLLNQKLQHVHAHAENVKTFQMRNDLNIQRLKFLRRVVQVNLASIEYAFEHVSKQQFPVGNSLNHDKREKSEMEQFAGTDVQYLFYPSGAIKGETYYLKGILHGPSRFYSELGTLLSEALYRNGVLEGACRGYYLSGALYSNQYFHSGLAEGEQIYYYENGKVKSRLCYSKGNFVSAELSSPDGTMKRSIK